MFARIVRNCSQLSCRAVKSHRFLATAPFFAERLEKWNTLSSTKVNEKNMNDGKINEKAIDSAVFGSPAPGVSGIVTFLLSNRCRFCKLPIMLSERKVE